MIRCNCFGYLFSAIFFYCHFVHVSFKLKQVVVVTCFVFEVCLSKNLTVLQIECKVSLLLRRFKSVSLPIALSSSFLSSSEQTMSEA